MPEIQPPARAVNHPTAQTRSITWSMVAACAAVVAWAVAASLLNSSQLNDSLEQFVWGQALEWGYWKHPPLTSWIMWAALQVFGPSPNIAYMLGAVLSATTVCSTALLAKELFGDEVARYTALLLALHYELSRRAQVYNHNTVLVACVAVTALLVVLALRRRRDRDWVAVGIAGALAILAKYQAVIPIAGLLLPVFLGSWRPPIRQVSLAVGVAVVVVMPHVLWLLTHEFEAVRYAASSVAPAASHGARYAVSFTAMQIKYFLPAATFALMLFAFARRRLGMSAPAPALATRLPILWLCGLVGLPVLVVTLFLAVGTPVQSHWGFQTTQFLLIWIALVLIRRFGPWSRIHSIAWLAVQLVFLGTFVAEGAGILRLDPSRLQVHALPAATLSKQAHTWWQASTGCRLDYLSGNVAWAGMLAAYSPHVVRVLEDGDPAKSPWINLDDMHARGWVDVAAVDLPRHDEGSLVLRLSARGKPLPQGQHQFLLLTPHAPTGSCAPAR